MVRARHGIAPCAHHGHRAGSGHADDAALIRIVHQTSAGSRGRPRRDRRAAPVAARRGKKVIANLLASPVRVEVSLEQIRVSLAANRTERAAIAELLALASSCASNSKSHERPSRKSHERTGRRSWKHRSLILSAIARKAFRSIEVCDRK